MSSARECDKCGELFKAELGCVQIDLHAYNNAESLTGWTEIDLCKACSAPIVELMLPVCDDLDKVLAGEPGVPE